MAGTAKLQNCRKKSNFSTPLYYFKSAAIAAASDSARHNNTEYLDKINYLGFGMGMAWMLSI
jgi:hypothetical protein